MLHAVYRVGNMDDYVKYMQDCFGMKLLRYRDIPEEKYTNAFLGYKPEETNFCLELTYVCPDDLDKRSPHFQAPEVTRFCALARSFSQLQLWCGVLRSR
jgi:lactoylglutathione lyase